MAKAKKKKETSTKKKSRKQSDKTWMALSIGLVVVIAFILVINFNQGPQEPPIEDLPEQTTDLDQVVMIVNGQEVTEREIVQLQAAFASDFGEIPREQAMDQLVSQILLYQKAVEEGYQVSLGEAEQQIEELLMFSGFTLEEFKEQLELEGLNYDEQLEFYAEQFAIERYVDSLFSAEDFDVTEEEAREFYDAVSLQNPDLPPYEEIEDEVIAALIQERQQEAINTFIAELVEQADIQIV